ncbi:MAG: SRPBCC family protein [Candidatus Omnitrophica bacterium]|nr:SRPBCC family protein [Candidatus Omnitrophota bacterium]
MVPSYSFVTLWKLKGPLEKVWEAIYHSERWPAWWKGVESVEEIRAAAGLDGVGSVRRFTWKSRLPYRLTFDVTVARVEPMALIESIAEGELAGTGRWTFSRDGDGVLARYDWNVRTSKPWMNLLAPVARPVFRWNHDVIMNWGLQGIDRLLAV